jgi:ribonuclease R
VRALLERMHVLAMILRARRFAQGALDLQLPEVKLDFDNDGAVSGAHKVVHDESHQIIEEFMLAANIAVATTLSQKGLGYLHRVHAPPDERKLRALGDFVRGLGFTARPWVGRRELQTLLDQVRGRPAEYPVSYALLRSLKQAEYSPADIGHFALAEEYYCHFTSPIRRYPDLTVHRLVDAIARHSGRVKSDPEGKLVALGEHCSGTERRAAAAERELIKVKLLTFLANRIGIQLDATITGVERFGLFCQGIELPAEGLVHIKTLPPDQYDYDQKLHTLTARRKGTRYRLGDRVRVEVAAVDLHRRTLEMTLVESTKADAKKGSKRRASPRRR